MGGLPGLEWLYLLVHDEITCKNDNLVLIIHCLLIRDGKKCVGTNDEWPDEIEKASEMLPKGWNSNPDVYTLRYTCDSPPHRYLLKMVKAGQAFFVNLMAVNEEKAAGMSVNLDTVVSDNISDFSEAFKNIEEVKSQFGKELGHIMKHDERPPGPTSSRKIPETVTIQQEFTSFIGQGRERQQPSPPPLQPSLSPPLQPSPLGTRNSEENRFPSVGRGDLDPLAGGSGGGMLVDPSTFNYPRRPGPPNFGIGVPGGLPRGAVPPGARFDPIGPYAPGTSRGRGFAQPDPDHLPPPGYDDMFM